MNKLIGVLGLIAAMVVGVFMLDAYFKESTELKNAYTQAITIIIEKNHSKLSSEGHVVYKNKNNNIAGCIYVDDSLLRKQRKFRFIKYKHIDEIEVKESECELLITP